MTDDDTTKRAALHMLKTGQATRAEVARLANRSHQVISYWAKDLPPDARSERLARLWLKALRLKQSRL
jgi:hypothetical protein